jgi:hypothetical protein
MKKQFILLLVLILVSINSNSHPIDAPIPFSEPMESKMAMLANKFNINMDAVRLAMNGFEKLKNLGRISNLRYLTIADFSKPSNEERLFVVDMMLGEVVIKTLVAHGKNSGTLFANQFSNKNASHQSSLGFYVTGHPYKGKHGTSLELNGVEMGFNDQAKNRAIVIHGADYVSKDFIQQQGYIGRSQGCPAVPNNKVSDIILAIQGASCMFIYAPNKDYLKKSLLAN